MPGNRARLTPNRTMERFLTFCLIVGMSVLWAVWLVGSLFDRTPLYYEEN